jgi:hypothetical protein
MKSKRFVAAAVLLVITCCFSESQAQQDPAIARILSQLDDGSVKGNVYENKLLGLRLKFPSSMKVGQKAELETDLAAGIELLRQGKPVNDKRLADMMLKERVVFSLSSETEEDPVGVNMSLTIKKDETREDLPVMTGRSIKFFTEGGKFKLAKGPASENLGPLPVVSFTLTMDHENVRIVTRNYAARRNGYLMTFSAAFINEKEFLKMESVLKSIELF